MHVEGCCGDLCCRGVAVGLTRQVNQERPQVDDARAGAAAAGRGQCISHGDSAGVCRGDRGDRPDQKVCSGTVPVFEGDPPTEFQIILEGHVRLAMNVPGQGRVDLLTVGAGEILAWSALLSDGELTATGTASDSTLVLAIPGFALKQLCDQQPEFGYPVMKKLAVALSRRLLATRIQLLDLFSTHEPVVSSAHHGRLSTRSVDSRISC